MKISRIGGIIAAASIKRTKPLLKVGSISVIQRIVISYQQTGIFPIVVVTGAEEYEVRYQLSGYGVIFIRNEDSESAELFESVKLGLEYLQGKCDRVVFAPVNVPMFTADTLRVLLSEEGGIVTPSYKGCGGHPVVIAEGVIPDILAFEGEGGLRSAMAAMPEYRKVVSVPDPGVTITISDGEQLQELLAEHNHALLHPRVQLSLERESSFFNPRIKLLLYLIHDTHSVRSACDRMALSYGKAWNMLNKLEEETGFPIVERKHGGKRGGSTTLTQQGLKFLRAWIQFEDRVFCFTQAEFVSLFHDSGLIS